jgi:hypothetical protein
MEWLPKVRDDVVNVAVPPDTVPVPIWVAPSENVTVPVGEETPLTVAVNVTDWPSALGSSEDVMDVFVAAVEMLPLTVVVVAVCGVGVPPSVTLMA